MGSVAGMTSAAARERAAKALRTALARFTVHALSETTEGQALIVVDEVIAALAAPEPEHDTDCVDCYGLGRSPTQPDGPGSEYVWVECEECQGTGKAPEPEGPKE